MQSNRRYNFVATLVKYSVLPSILSIVLNFSPSELLCELCIGGTAGNKKEAARINNCNVLKQKVNVDCLDDSYNDPDYVEAKESDASVKSDIYDFNDEEEFFNPFETNSRNSSVFNPFGSNTSSKLPSVCSEDQFNSTETFNPFSESSPKSSYKEKTKQVNTCPYCDKGFLSSYNMKQHQISVHKIFPPGIKIFQCTVKNCVFVTGSRVSFNRHSHARLTLKESKVTRPSCPVCNEQFFNLSSLKRHMIRKKHLQ